MRSGVLNYPHGVPAKYPDDAADPPQPSHRQISGGCHRCMDLVYHGCRLATCLPAMPDDRHTVPGEGGPDERLGQPGPGDEVRSAAWPPGRCPGDPLSWTGAGPAVPCNCLAVRVVREGPSSLGMPRR